MEQMKRIRSIIIILAITISICGCGRTGDVSNPKSGDVTNNDETVNYGDFLDVLYDGNGFVCAKEVKWGSNKDEFIKGLPSEDQLDPESDSFVQNRNTKMPNDHSSVQPPVIIKFADIDTSMKPVYLFDEDDKLYCAKYGIIMDKSQEDEYQDTLKNIVSMIYEKHTESSVGGKEYLEKLKDIDFNNDKIDIVWHSENDDSFIRITSVYFNDNYLVDVIVGLSSYFNTLD